MSQPSLPQLKELQQKLNFHFTLGERPFDWMQWVKVTTGQSSWDLLLHDEFHDLDNDKPLVCLYLLLYALEDYQDTEDYLEWCKEYMIKPPELLTYYNELGSIYAEFEKMVGTIEIFISSMDYQLRAGEYSELLRMYDQK